MQVRLGQRAEHDDVVQPVQKFRAERPLGFVHDPFAHLLVAVLVRDGREAQRATAA